MATVIKPKRSETALSVPAANSLAVGELAMNVTDGKFYTKTSGGVVKEVGGAGAVTLNSVTSVVANDSYVVSYLLHFISISLTVRYQEYDICAWW